MRTSTKHFIVSFALVGLITFTLVSCDLLGVSKEQRVTMFLDDLNLSARNNMYLNFDPSSTLYGGIDDVFFYTHFPTESIPYYLTNQNFDTDPVTATIMGQTSTGNDFSPAPLEIRFTMTQDGFDWYISELWLEGSGTIVY